MNLLKAFFEGVNVITVLDFARDSIPYHSTSVLKSKCSYFLKLFCSSGLMLGLSQYKQTLDLCWSGEVIYLMNAFR